MSVTDDDISGLPREQLRALAEHPGTDGEMLARLARLPGIDLLPAIVGNPSTPPAVRAWILRDFPHLKAYWTSAPEPAARPAASEADQAIERFRQRSAQSARGYGAGVPASRPAAAPSYVQAVDQAGRTVLIPAAALTPRRTNGLAIASLVLSLLGASLLGVIFGHVAKRQIWERGDDGDGLATAGLLIGYLGLVFLAVLVVIGLANS